MFRGSPTHDGVYPGRGTTAYGGVQWRFRAGGAIHGSPVVAGGVVYVGSSDGKLYALDARTGSEKWSRALGSPVSSTPAIADGVVFVQTHAGRVVALHARSGAPMWSHDGGKAVALPWGHESGDLYASSPTLAAGMLLIGGGDGALYALDAKSGRERWHLTTRGRVRSSPAVHAGRVFVGSFDGDVYAADLASGKLVWRFETEGHSLDSGKFGYDRRSVQSSPAVANGIVAFGSRDGHFYGLDEATGAQRWRLHDTVWWINASPAMQDGRAYASSSDGRYVEAVDAASGKPVWTFDAQSNFFGSPSIAGDVVFDGDFAGRLHAIDKSTGKELWRFGADRSRIVSTPVIADDRVYFGADDGSVFAINLTHGPALKRAVFWDTAYAKGTIISSNERLKTYFASRDYEVLGADALRAFLEARIADRAPSVVVFAMDDLPDAVRDDARGRGPFRRYLDAGGKVVWPGVPPTIVQPDRTSGEVDIAKIDRSRPAALLGVRFDESNFDPLTQHATAAGRRWNLDGWWNGTWSADAASVTTALTIDENGGAGAWVKRYGGPEGTGFVSFPVPDAPEPSPRYMGMLQVAAELFPR
ncbi:MAG: Pyrrolo-quinoline quinone [Candidatus Eremiobacteraeota bacterium]|nr:Pyrrolo-quinoline quinone [Candidatus Eremiobacteraeota bacterium]